MQGVITSITDVFSSMFSWMSDSIPTITAIFYTSEKGLSFLGTLAVVALGISIFFLIMGLVQNFLHLRG